MLNVRRRFETLLRRDNAWRDEYASLSDHDLAEKAKGHMRAEPIGDCGPISPKRKRLAYVLRNQPMVDGLDLPEERIVQIKAIRDSATDHVIAGWTNRDFIGWLQRCTRSRTSCSALRCSARR